MNAYFRFVRLLGAALLSFGAMAPALALPVTLDTGSSVLFNFDFTGQSPPPPYAQIDAFATLAGFESGESLTFTVFNGLNGTGGAAFGLAEIGPLPTLSLSTTFPEILDGVFSIRFTATAGSFQITDSEGTGLNSDFVVVASAPGIQARAVPEPATLALLAIGVVGIGLARRRIG